MSDPSNSHNDCEQAMTDKADPRVIYTPKKVVATYVDTYGDERIIHSPQGGKALRVANTSDTPCLRMNRAVGILMGGKIRARRTELGITAKALCERMGLANTNAKQYIYGIETAFRAQGVRLGTLYALADALECEITDLLPAPVDVRAMAGVSRRAVVGLSVVAA